MARRPRTPEQLLEAFWQRVEKTEYCWLWHGTRATTHGRFYFNAKQSIAAHYYAWKLEHGYTPRMRTLKRNCDEPFCVRPKHYRIHHGNVRGRKSTKCASITDVDWANRLLSADLPTDGSAAQTVLKALREKTIEDRRAFQALGALARGHEEQLRKLHREVVTTREQLFAELHAIEARPIPQYDAVLGRIEGRLVSLADMVREPVRKPPEPPTDTASNNDAPAPLAQLLRDAFTDAIGGSLMPPGSNLALDQAFEMALSSCDGDRTTTSDTFRSWLTWYRGLHLADGAQYPATPLGFLGALTSSDVHRPAPSTARASTAPAGAAAPPRSPDIEAVPQP
jgi:hypothetical protein